MTRKHFRFGVEVGWLRRDAMLKQVQAMAALIGVDLSYDERRCWLGLERQFIFAFSGSEYNTKRFTTWVNGEFRP